MSPKPLPDGGPDGGDDDVLASGGGCAYTTATGAGAPKSLPMALGVALGALAAAARRPRRSR